MSFERIIIFTTAGLLLSGCHIVSRLNPDCHTRQEYQRAAQMAPLKVPSGLDSPNPEPMAV